MTIKDKLSPSSHRLQGQPMFRLLERVKQLEAQGKNIIHFEIGDPDFDTPPAIVAACVDSLKRGETHYTSSYGLHDLRVAIAEDTQKELGFKPDINQVLVAPGANPLIYFVIQCLVDQDEEVIIPDPSFSTYESVLSFMNIKAVRVPLREENAFRMNPEDVQKSITPKTKLIILNSPQNPTGSVMTRQEVDAIYALAEAHDIFILSDEIYRLMAYGVDVASVATNDGCRERTIIMSGFSKSFAMTGWRLGYMIAPSELVDKVSLLLQTIVSCVSPFIQRAGMAVLGQAHPEALAMRRELERRRDVIVAGLNQLPGVSCLKPQGAFYVFPNITKTGMTSKEFADMILDKAGVALLPGTDFGQFGEGYVRLCYANSVPNIEEGLRRMKTVLESQR